MTRFRDHDPRFLRDLRMAVRERAGRRQVTLRRPGWNRERHFNGEAVWALVMVLGVVGGMSRGSIGETPSDRGAIEAVYAIGALLLVGTVERSITGLLHHWPDLMTALRLPADDEWMVRRQWGRAVGRMSPVLLAAFLGGSTVALQFGAGGMAVVGAVLFAVLLSVVVLSAATWFAGTGRGGWLTLGFWVVFLVFWIGSKVFPDLQTWVGLVLNRYGDWVVLLLPTGWVIRPFHRWLEGGEWRDWMTLLPAMVLVLSLPAALRRLMAKARVRDHVLLVYGAQLPDDADDALREAVQQALTRPAARPLGELRSAVLGREFLKVAAAPSRGIGTWTERLLWRLWTPRERLLAEFAFARLPAWSRHSAIAIALLAVALLAAGVGSWFGIAWLQLAWLGVVALFALVLTPIIPSVGRLQQTWISGQCGIPVAAIHPISVAEIGRWALKTAAIRVLLGTPLALFAGAVLGWIEPDLVSPWVGMQCTAVALVLILGSQPLWLAGGLLGHRWPHFVGSGRWFCHGIWLGFGLAWLVFSVAAVVVTYVGNGMGGGTLAFAAVVTGSDGFRWMCLNIRRGRLDRMVPASAAEVGG